MTPKQEAYCHARAEGLEPIDAAKKAGYNPDHATRQAHRMENNSEVQVRIAELKAVKHIQSKQKQGKAVSTDMLAAPVANIVNALDFLNTTYNDANQPMKVRVQAAVAALPYEEARIAPKGKKEGAVDGAKKAATTGRFATLSNQSDMFATDTTQ